MDDIVKQALAKWPNVPHCYGWLALDARGNWRMRDERAQHFNLPGDKLTNAALVGFITRNYAVDERGCWYFQNGPQRVYVQLEATPFIVRTDPAAGWLLHTGAPLGPLDAALLTEAGALVLRRGDIIAQLDDRDFADVLPRLLINEAPVADEVLLAWMEGRDESALSLDGILVERIAADRLAARYGYVSVPSAPAA
ncbi:DUF2946 family protein [Duganella radicis]|uniref:DUF2946 family protein n=1 Tax=Duganella radicis TaxID=551988 RepID=A0A6L6PFW8_9BURK|nr:DUF2946 family protein [Duganella radicis]MTV37451.1 DUF2946 family protein [Duganella radicis]